MPEVIELIESTSALVPLDSSQLDELTRLSQDLAGSNAWWGSNPTSHEPRDSRVIRIEPRGKGRYAVTVHNAIGALGLPELTLIVRPKIPIDHFAYISRRALIRTERLDTVPLGLAGGNDFIDLVAGWYIDNLETLLRQGLAMDYREETSLLTTVRGQVHMTASSLRWLTGRAEVVCTYDEFDSNTPLNRVLKTACLAVAGSPLIRDALRMRASRALRQLSEVRPLEHGDLQTAPERAASRYQGSLILARQVIASQGRTLAPGVEPSRSFLYRTPELIEDGIREILRAELAPTLIRKRGRVLIPSAVSVNPDLELDRPPFTGDVKYKLAGNGWNRSDLAQAVFFAAAYRSPLALLIAFQNHDTKKQSPLKVGDITVTSALWDVSSGVEAASSAANLLRQVRRFLNPNLGG